MTVPGRAAADPLLTVCDVQQRYALLHQQVALLHSQRARVGCRGPRGVMCVRGGVEGSSGV
jgi:hypothetical protein